MKRIKLFTLGCKVNQYETQAIREGFFKKGYKESDNGKADIYIINTCTVTQTADRKSREYIYRSIRKNPKAKIVVTGCLVEKDKDKIENISGVDFIVPNVQKNRIAEIISDADDSFLSDNRRYDDLCISDFAKHSKAFIKIQDGCDNRCSYCKVSVVRGVSRSRRLENIIDEASCLIKNDYKELVLTGICLGSYGKDLKEKIDLVDVIDQVESINGGFRIRLSSIEAKDVTDRLIKKMVQSPRLCRHLHVPFQSGDDEILRLMNRKYTKDYYVNLVKKIRRHIPMVGITTDIMVGFPGEAEKRFRNSVDFLEEVRPHRMHIFPYSPRKHTAAFSFKDRIAPHIVKERLNHLQGLAKKYSYEYRKSFLNEELEVLVENRPDKNLGLATGYSDNYIKMLIKDKKVSPMKLVKTKVIEVAPQLTVASLVKIS